MNVWPLDIHDLAASKLMAGRDKDFEFLQFLFIIMLQAHVEFIHCAQEQPSLPNTQCVPQSGLV
jgi:hypothetical protein